MFFGHETFTIYQSMTRIWKLYDFNFNSSVANQISFSSYPGTIMSGDDFYITDRQLAVMETTNAVYNDTLFKQYLNPAISVLEAFRVMAANRLANDSKTWVDQFSKFNDGTYNNQWMVFDYKLFTPGKPLPSNTFWIAEQLPGIASMTKNNNSNIFVADMSDFLNK